MSDSVRTHRRQPTRLPRPWDPPGKNIGVGCHFLLQCMKVKSESEVAQSYLTQRPHGLQPTRLLHPWGFPEYWIVFSEDHKQDTAAIKVQNTDEQIKKMADLDIIQYSVQLSSSVMFDPLQSHESWHARPPCPLTTPGVHSNSNSCPSSW